MDILLQGSSSTNYPLLKLQVFVYHKQRILSFEISETETYSI